MQTFRSLWVRSVIATFWLPTWFAAHALAGIANALQDTTLLYFDAHLYLDAARTWMAGGDPWSVSLAGNYFAAPPPSLLPLVPLAMLPPDLGVAILASLIIGAAIATVYLLRLPWWWILFPPLIQCILSANVHGLLIPLILLRGGAIASLLKVYAAVPLVIMGRWWAVLATAALLLVTAPILPWGTYIAELATISERLADQTKHHIPVVLLILASPVALFAAVIVGRERAAWLLPLALWPSQQYYYGSLAMPTRSNLAAAIVALPVTGSGLIAITVLAVAEWHRGHRPALPRWWSRDG
jgi:hypothetical protein